jgi:hypothetical protein
MKVNIEKHWRSPPGHRPGEVLTGTPEQSVRDAGMCLTDFVAGGITAQGSLTIAEIQEKVGSPAAP